MDTQKVKLQIDELVKSMQDKCHSIIKLNIENGNSNPHSILKFIIHYNQQHQFEADKTNIIPILIFINTNLEDYMQPVIKSLNNVIKFDRFIDFNEAYFVSEDDNVKIWTN